MRNIELIRKVLLFTQFPPPLHTNPTPLHSLWRLGAYWGKYTKKYKRRGQAYNWKYIEGNIFSSAQDKQRSDQFFAQKMRYSVLDGAFELSHQVVWINKVCQRKWHQTSKNGRTCHWSQPQRSFLRSCGNLRGNEIWLHLPLHSDLNLGKCSKLLYFKLDFMLFNPSSNFLGCTIDKDGWTLDS